MRFSALVLNAALCFCGTLSALAADKEGRIAAVNEEKMTITLNDGLTYKLPAEIDMSSLEKGVEVVIDYRIDEAGMKQITDMFMLE